jgi:hypothetical protein
VGRFRVSKKGRNGIKTTSPEYESPDAVTAFSDIERDQDCIDAEIWQDGELVGKMHRKGSEKSPFWLIDERVEKGQDK